MNDALKYYICEKCGGELSRVEDGHFYCKYCKVDYYKEITLPEGLVIDLHNAGMDRNIRKFEDALNKYDIIISKYPECFDAYWGATLSDYGIQYEKDYDGRMIPTVHRFSETSVYENSYYVNTIRFCKSEQEKERIEKSAGEIERIRSEIKKTVGAQKPYDIFLCYKETPIGDDGGYTSEFYWADDLYRRLSGEGYKVFFAKESLPVAKGDYEAHIFPALRSAKLMLILATSVENLESVWVKNEWSRFIRFSKENPSSGKRFKLIGSGFKPEKLPRELRNEQMLNHDSMGWVDQLYSIISDTFRDEKKEEEERKRREKEEQAARFAKMLEEERGKWTAEEQRKRKEEERKKSEEEELKKREEDRRKREEEERRKREEEESRVKVGESIKFGSYPQDRSGKKAEIKWIVLDVKDGKALVVSQKALDCQKYNETETDVTWETCTLRNWLNNEFLNTAFTAEESDAISPVTLPDIPFDDDDAKDKLFLLNTAEAKKYFISNSDKFCKSTGYAASKGAYIDKDSGNSEWWLRTSGAEPTYAVSVSYSGMINYYGSSVDSDYTAVRPAMWIDLDELFGEANKIPCALCGGKLKKIDENHYECTACGERFYKNPLSDTDSDAPVLVSLLCERCGGKLNIGEHFYECPYCKHKISKKQFSENVAAGIIYVEKQLDDGFYIGYTKNGVPNGSGKITYKNGNVYEGGWNMGVPCGDGKVSFTNGDVFEGVFKIGKSKTKGIMTYVNGKKAKGRLKNGVFKKRLF